MYTVTPGDSLLL